MDSDYENFKTWYVDTLNKLYPDRNSGFAILMITFPLLERYLRHKNRLSHKDILSNRCMDELRRMFPCLPSTEDARKFWSIFRNGILHQVTLSRENKSGILMPEGLLSHDKNSAITIESDGSFLIHPVLFSKHIVDIIRAILQHLKKDLPFRLNYPRSIPILQQQILGKEYRLSSLGQTRKGKNR